MRATEAAYSIIRKFESFRDAPYNCPAGHATIGYGHKIHDGSVTARDKDLYREFEETDAEALLRGDVAWSENALRKMAFTGLTQNQYDSLVSMHFNCPSAFRPGRSLRKALDAHDWPAAAAAIMLYVKADIDGDGVIESNETLPGLVARRTAEKALFEGKPA